MNRDHNTGFTLVELMFSMTFLSLLLVAIALSVIQISNIYNRGVTYKTVNQAGREVSRDMRSAIEAASAFDINGTSGEPMYRVQANGGNVYGGRLCTGLTTYIWNTAAGIQAHANDADAPLNVLDSDPSGLEPLRLIRTYDPRGVYCQDPSTEIANTDETVELLDVGDRNLAVHTFSILSGDGAIDISTGQRLYTISIQIGTDDTTEVIASGSSTDDVICDVTKDRDFCAINRFLFTAKAGDRVQ